MTDRDFTRLETHRDDLAALALLTHRLEELLATPDFPTGRRVTLDEKGREHFVLISQPRSLRSTPERTVVGFFGQKNPAASPQERQALWDIDDELIEEVARHPGIFSLSCLELEGGNYGNLVVLADREAADHWRTSPLHSRAVHEHSPRNYLSIRIHNGSWNPGRLTLDTTKYYDFRGDFWRAERRLEPALTAELETADYR